VAQQIVFYSWQSWTDKKANRNLIEDCLEKAIRQIRKDDSMRLDPVMDRDTQGVPGSPDIADTIFEKVAAADVFVADVSFVHSAGVGHPTPNPNVLVELGYALGTLGAKKVICVLNTATGRVEDLPFDVRGKRTATYHLPPEPEGEGAENTEWLKLREEARGTLVPLFKVAIVAILSATDPAISEFCSQLARQLGEVLIYGSEGEDREINPGPEQLRVTFRQTAGELRSMACKAVAERLELREPLVALAGELEAVVNFTRSLGRENWARYQELIKAVVATASRLKAVWVDPHPLGRNEANRIYERLCEIKRELDHIASGLDGALRVPDGLSRVQSQVSALGHEICRYAHYNLDKVQPGFAARLQPAGKNLHLVGVATAYRSGGQRAYTATVNGIEQFAKAFGEVMDSVPPRE